MEIIFYFENAKRLTNKWMRAASQLIVQKLGNICLLKSHGFFSNPISQHFTYCTLQEPCFTSLLLLKPEIVNKTVEIEIQNAPESDLHRLSLMSSCRVFVHYQGKSSSLKCMKPSIRDRSKAE